MPSSGLRLDSSNHTIQSCSRKALGLLWGARRGTLSDHYIVALGSPPASCVHMSIILFHISKVTRTLSQYLEDKRDNHTLIYFTNCPPPFLCRAIKSFELLEPLSLRKPPNSLIVAEEQEQRNIINQYGFALMIAYSQNSPYIWQGSYTFFGFFVMVSAFLLKLTFLPLVQEHA